MKSLSIDVKTLNLLSALGRDPVAPVTSLSKDSGLSMSTVKKRLAKLYEEKTLMAINAQIGTFTLGLEPKIVFIEAKPDQWETVTKLCDLHPYTRYRILSFGSCNGFYTQFAIPPHTSMFLTELFDRLVQRRSIERYEIVNLMSHPIITETDYGFYDFASGWGFDWEAWEKSIAGAEEAPLKRPPPSVLYRLDEPDMRILRQLSIDARRKGKDIAAAAGVESYHLSRRRKVMERLGVIQGYRVSVGMQLLQLTSHAVLRCECGIKTSRKISTAVKALPFQSTFAQVPDGFVLYVTITSPDFPVLVTALQRHCDSIIVDWCDYRSSFRYWFYDEPFVDDNWRADYDYMVGSIFTEL